MAVGGGGLGVAAVADEGDVLPAPHPVADREAGGEGVLEAVGAVVGPGPVVVDVEVGVVPAVVAPEVERVALGSVAQLDHDPVDAGQEPTHLGGHQILSLVAAGAALAPAGHPGVGPVGAALDGEHDRPDVGSRIRRREPEVLGSGPLPAGVRLRRLVLGEGGQRPKTGQDRRGRRRQQSAEHGAAAEAARMARRRLGTRHDRSTGGGPRSRPAPPVLDLSAGRRPAWRGRRTYWQRVPSSGGSSSTRYSATASSTQSLPLPKMVWPSPTLISSTPSGRARARSTPAR